MVSLLLAVTVIQTKQIGPPASPVKELLSTARAWSVWQKPEKELAEAAISALDKRDFVKADADNRQLLALAPQSIYDNPPTLPQVLIRPAGTAIDPATAEAPISGWIWKRESAWLAVWAGRQATGLALFLQVMNGSAEEAVKSVEGAMFCLSRLKSYGEALRLSDQVKVGTPELKRAFKLAHESKWIELRSLALAAGAAPMRAQENSGPRPTLSGPIGGGKGQTKVLPPTQPSQAKPSQNSGPSWGSIEAAHILLDKSMTAWRAKKSSSQLKAEAVIWINVLLKDAREAFPHHRQAAYSALDELRG